jgi:hypothetical protein
MNKVYVAIDLKSFYASCECVELGLDPLNTNLVVADQSRTEKTICLAVSPSLKSYGISGRARLFHRIFDKTLLARRINHVACNVIKESDVPESESYEQLSLFDTEETIQDRADDEKALEKERALQEAMLTIKHKFGKNAVLKGTNFTEGATAKERNRQIGGHKA